MATKTERSIAERVQDVPYVALGAGDAAVELIRTVPSQIVRLPQQVKEGFDELADRGRTLRTEVKRAPAVRRAGQQTSTAKSRVKAAATSSRKAVGAQAKAAEQVASKIG
ncbi:MAG: hypothetical protein JWO68_2124 [Actinomycetia bacterium]|nr:hypothetical protein [Actinomycetes bacterium]